MKNNQKNSALLFFFLFAFSLIYSQEKTISINPSQTGGAIDLLIGTNAGPIAITNYAIDYTSLFKELGIKAIRTQDYYGPCDWNSIFRDWSADFNNPNSYYFAGTDSIIQKIRNSGFEILFRIGTSWKTTGSRINDPPGTIRNSSGQITHFADTNDFKKFAEICKRIVMHYNDGWANGFKYNITKWEVWNEPSYYDQFWFGNETQFQQMFSIVIKSLKAYNPLLIIGGPGEESNTPASFEQNLIKDCKNKSTPLDFYSFHSYGGTVEYSMPYDVGRKAINARALLNSNGYTSTKLYCTEFNSEINENNYANSARGAAFYTSAFIYLVLNGVSELYQYRADNHPLGMVMDNGQIKRAAESMKAWKALTELPIRISASGTDTNGFTVIATKDNTGEIMRILVSNFKPSSGKINISINNLPVTGKWSIVRKTISSTIKFAVTDSVSVASSGTSLPYTFLMGGESVEYLEIKKTSSTGTEAIIKPHDFALMQNYPNPFNPSTVIGFQLPVSCYVTLKVYDLLGKEIATLANEYKQSGLYYYSFTPGSSELSSGVLYYQLSAGGLLRTKKMIVIK